MKKWLFCSTRAPARSPGWTRAVWSRPPRLGPNSKPSRRSSPLTCRDSFRSVSCGGSQCVQSRQFFGFVWSWHPRYRTAILIHCRNEIIWHKTYNIHKTLPPWPMLLSLSQIAVRSHVKAPVHSQTFLHITPPCRPYIPISSHCNVPAWVTWSGNFRMTLFNAAKWKNKTMKMN